MNTIKIYLAESGRIADVHKDFPLFKGQFNDKLLNVYVPTSILAPSFSIQHYIGQMQGLTLPTDVLLEEFVANNTYPSREPLDGDIIEFVKVQDNEPQEYYVYIYNNNAWTSEEVETFGTFNNIAGTSVLIGMLATKRNGLIYESKNYYMRYLKTLTYQNVEYALYERKLPKEFTSFVGQGENAPILVMNVVNVDLQTRDTLSIITSQSAHFDVMQSTMLDEDEPIEASTEQEFRAELDILNAEMPNKQDKESENLTTTSHLIVGAINEINAKALNNASDIDALERQVDTNTDDIADIKAEQITQNTGIGANTDDIVSLQNRVSTLEQYQMTGETYIGTMTGVSLPTDIALNNYVQEIAGRQPKSGDYIYFTLEISGGTDKNYRYTYGLNGWGGAEIPPMERADNSTYGIIKGSYEENTTKKTQVNISGGEIEDIYVVDNSNSKRRLAEYLNTDNTRIGTNATNIAQNTQDISGQGTRLTTAEGKITDIISGTQAVGKSISAEKDSLDRNIANTYMTQSAGATKQELKDYALPRAFNDVSFVSENNEYSDIIPTDVNPLYTITINQIGDSNLFYVDKTIANAEFELGNKNSYSNTIYITANRDCSVAYRVTTQLYHNGSWTTLNAELTDIVDMVSGVIKKVNFGSPFNSMTDIVDVVSGDIIRQTFEVQTDFSTSTTFNVYSNVTYPSTFYLNTTAQTIVVAQGYLGEIPYYNLNGVLNNDTITFDITVVLRENTLGMFKLNYASTIAEGTKLRLSYNGTSVRIITPYNYTTSDDATINDLYQVYQDSTGLLFKGFIKTIGGDLSVIADIDNLQIIIDAFEDLALSKQDVIDANNKIDADYVNDTNSTNKFATAEQLAQIQTNATDISSIKEKIPSDASASNQLAPKSYVNDAVQTASSNFRGNWATWSAVPTNANDYPLDDNQSRTPTQNDYMVVQDASDYTGATLTGTWRFKYSGTWATNGKNGWHEEYQVNETPLTTQQLNALNSGIDSSKVAQIATNTTDIANRVVKQSGTNKVYTKNASGNDDVLDYSTSATGNSIAQRTSGGKLKGATPTENDDLTTKLYVDDGLANKVNKTTNSDQIYGTDGNGNQKTYNKTLFHTSDFILLRFSGTDAERSLAPNIDKQIAPLYIEQSNGNLLTFDSTNNSVIIGAGVSKVKIMALIEYYQNSSGTRFSNAIKLNGSDFNNGSSYISASPNYQYSRQQCVNITVANVTENDVITFVTKSVNSNSSNPDKIQNNQTRFLVEVIC